MESVVIPATALVPRLNGKDSRWLTLEACPDFLQGSCVKSEDECRYAHPPSHVEIQNGRVTCCYDSIKGKCSRTNPPCKYLHPPLHLREQLLETGRQNLILKNLQVQSAAMASGIQPVMPVQGAMYPLVYENGAIKQVLPSNYPAVVIPGQYPYMQPPVAQPFTLQNSAGVPLQYLSAQQTSYPNRVIHMVNPSNGTIPLQSINPAPVPASAQVLLPGVSGTGVYGQQVALASPLAMANQMELCYMPDGTYTYQASSWSGPLGATDARQLTPATSTASSSAMGNQFADVAVTTSSSDAASSSYSLATSLGLYQTPVAYHQQATQILETASSNSRKRTRDALMATNGASLVPVLKRPALMDSTSGLPVYQTYSATSPYQPMAITALSPQPYLPISLPNKPTILPHF